MRLLARIRRRLASLKDMLDSSQVKVVKGSFARKGEGKTNLEGVEKLRPNLSWRL